MKKIVLTFGILSGLIIIIYSAAVFLVFGEFSKMSDADFNKVEKLGYLRYIILLLTIIFAVLSFKKQNGGKGSFKQLFLAGFYTALVVGLLVGLMELVYIMMNPNFMQEYSARMETMLRQGGASAEKLASHRSEIESMKWMANPVGMGVFYFIETSVLGTVIAVLTALIARTKKA